MKYFKSFTPSSCGFSQIIIKYNPLRGWHVSSSLAVGDYLVIDYSTTQTMSDADPTTIFQFVPMGASFPPLWQETMLFSPTRRMEAAAAAAARPAPSVCLREPQRRAAAPLRTPEPPPRPPLCEEAF